ncbi:TetR/AcrR family transcriptional regulator C-terminal domain-containing protein [Streptomyces sp. NPDC049555]|uniref:TetR/AcrR family transcriptional regulator C-terminal domain-containing protein n=1 Tax=unclassified Streptomyces TaxID=2593676 RepID=UPI00343A5F33
MADHQLPPYLRIAAELRRRIAEGELAPGDRVPSTRQIAKEWNVALATATKVLTALRQEGLVEARPRAGTVVAARPGRAAAAPVPQGAPATAPAADGELTRERIVRAAIAIADEDGIAALSMRTIAARLGVAAMSPYRHVTGKEDLLLLMADAVLAEASYPVDAPPHWRGRLEAGARTLWALHRAHPWLARIAPLTRPVAVPNLIAYSEWMLGALDGHGLAPAAMFNINVLLYSYVQGTAVHLEREDRARRATGMSEEQWMDAQSAAFDSLMASGAYPTFTEVIGAFGEEGYDLDLDEVFELGLTSMLDGLTGLIDGRPAPARASREA